MFGRQYAPHLDVLMHSFGEMNEHYLARPKTQKDSGVLTTLKRWYIQIFGIPEIGFQIRSLYFQKLLALIPKENIKRVLDAGSGIGAYSFFLAHTYPVATVTGGDIDKKKLSWCKKLRTEFKLSNTVFTFFDVTKTKLQHKQDLIVNIDVLEHVPNYHAALRNFSRQLTRDGYLYIHVPQPKQKRLFTSMKSWEHADHVREGIPFATLKKDLKNVGLTVLAAKQTFGFWGKLAWEINHMMLRKNFVFAGVFFPFLYILAIIDTMTQNKNGLCVAVLAKKK